MNDFWFQMDVFSQQRQWLRSEAMKVIRLRKSAFRERRINDITLRYLQLAREFNRFMQKQTKGNP